MTRADDPNDDIALCGEYVLHLLDPQARQAVEVRLAAEPGLRQLVAEWDAHFATLADEFASVAPPAKVKARIEAALFADPKRAGRAWSGWRLLLGGGFAAALGLAVLLVTPPADTPDTFAPSFAAEVAAEDQSLVVLASYAPDTGILRIDRQAGAARPGRVLELWLIAEGADGPISLGVLPAEPAVDISLPATVGDAVAGGTLAISDEPIGGSTTGAPTGDVLALGAVTAL